jgi:hypothetical protein
MKSRLNHKEGISLIWVVVFCTLLILVATIMTNQIVLESHISIRFDSSIRAYNAARSGINWGTYYLSSDGALTDQHIVGLKLTDSDSTYDVDINVTTKEIVSKGHSNGVIRVLKYTYTLPAATVTIPATTIANSSTAVQAPGDKQFGFSFNFWKSVPFDPTIPLEFGIENSTTENSIKVIVGDDGITLRVIDGTNPAVSKKIIFDSTRGNVNAQYGAKALISYIPGTGVQLELQTRDTDDNDLCFQRVTVPLVNIALAGRTVTFSGAKFVGTTLNVDTSDESLPSIGVLKVSDAGDNSIFYIDQFTTNNLTITP